jgi:predicted dehydrogenase
MTVAIGAGVVGTGFIGVVHVEALRRLGIDVRGVVGSTPERARAKAQTAPLPPVYDSLEEMLADRTVEVVHLTTPNHLHHPQVKAALAAGKHVVCEKPLALSSEESAELLELAEASGLVHAVNFNIRFYPLCQEARARCRAGDLGDLWAVRGCYLQDWLVLPTDWNWRLEPEAGGALRAVADIGSHWLDLTSFVTGLQVESVHADLRTVIEVRRRPVGQVETFAAAGDVERVDQPMTTDDAANIMLRYRGGARGIAAISQVTAGRRNRVAFEIDGSEAGLAWESERAEELWIGHRERPNEVLFRDPALMHEEARSRTQLPGGHAEGFADTFRELYRAVYAAVEAGGPPAEPDYPTFAEGHKSLLLGEAIARSAREDHWINL